MVDLFQEGMLHKDTALVMQSWNISEHLLAVDNDHAAWCYYHRAVILGWLGRMKEARENKWLEIQHLPNSNPDRLVYMSKKYTTEHNGDSANYYITRLLDFCDNNKHCKQDYRDYLRIIAVSLADGPSKGKVLLHKLLRANPRNELLVELQKNWKAFVESLSQDV